MLFGARLLPRWRSGQNGRPFLEYTMVNSLGQPLPLLGPLPQLWNAVRGDVALVGPQARCLGKLDMRSETARRISSVAPGLVSTWFLRTRTNVAYDSQADTDLQYLDSHSLLADLGIAARALVAIAYGGAPRKVRQTAEILGLPLDNLTLAEAIDEIVRPSAQVRQVSFVNVDCVNKSFNDPGYRNVLLTSDLRLADGIGLRIGGRLLGNEIRQNVNGTDLFPGLCKRMEQEGLGLFLLGGRPGVADDVAAWMRKCYPRIQVAGTQDGYFRTEEEGVIVERINQSGAAILLVALGAPGQEKWIRRNRHLLQVRSALGVGGLFDFYAGRIPRAPQWLRELGLEWTFRLYQEPGRMWRRYLAGNVVFLARVLVERWKLK